VQQALLKIIEGTVASVPPQGGRKHPNQEMLKIDTKNILFICSGAFVGLDNIVDSRISKHPMGFGADIKATHERDLVELYSHLHPDDLIRFGLIPEFVGRMPINVTLEELSLDVLIRIITEPRNAIVKQYRAAMKLDDVDLVFEDEAIEAIAKKARQIKTGARGLRAIVEKVMVGIMFDIPSIKGKKRVVVTPEVVEKSVDPEITLIDEKKTA
jgi:ATP-dependent Clp protease ATP-binding subunit ClpX